MVRAFGLVSVLVTLAVVSYLYTQSGGEVAQPAGGNVVQDLATEAAADATLLAARTGLESFFAASGTYAGAPVPAGVMLVAATPVSYCIQIGSGATARHVTSPGSGASAPGPC
jgi:Tfp pilus assembly protein PilE